MATSKKVARKAAKILKNPKAPKQDKSVAGSDLAQARKRTGKKK
jgi:hypothetical protein